MSRLTKADKQVLAQAVSETNKIVSIADEKVKKDSLNTMWAFMEMGAQKPNVPFLIESSLDQLMNFIIIETMCLWLSGGLNKLKDMEDENG